MKFREPISDLIKDPTEFTRNLGFLPPEKIKIYDTTLRDGEQTPGVAFSPQQKFQLAKALSDVGVDILDMGFPAVSQSEQDALRKVMMGKRRGEIRSELEILVMCRANRRDIDRTLETLRNIEVSPEDVTLFIFTAGSDLHIKYKLGKTLLRREGVPTEEWLDRPVSFYREANKRMIADAISYAKSQGVVSVEAGMGEDGSRSDCDYLIELSQACVDAGCTRLSVADTVGVLTPISTKFYMERLLAAFPDVPWVVHFHNDFDLATINTITALSVGTPIATVTVNGLGERAGNAPIHAVVGALWKLYGIKLPRFRYEKLHELKRLVEDISGIPIQGNEPIIGYNVFAHEAGIHTAAVLIDRRLYEHAPSEDFGHVHRFVFGKHSGRHLVGEVLRENSKRLEDAGLKVDEELVDEVVREVKRVREEACETNQSQLIVTDYYARQESLGLTEAQVIELAIDLRRMREDDEG